MPHKDMENTLESMTKWMRDLSLAANKAETDICLLFKCRPVHLTLNGKRLELKNVISFFRVQFDSRLHSSQHIVHATKN